MAARKPRRVRRTRRNSRTKGKRVNASGHQAEATVKRARPFGKDDRTARESQRRASAYGRARGNA